MLLAPARIHAQQDFGPILGLGPRRRLALTSRKQSLASTVAGEKAFQFLLRGQFAQRAGDRPRPLPRSRPRLRLAELDQAEIIGETGLEFANPGDALVKLSPLARSAPAP